MMSKEQIIKNFPKRITSRNYDYCREHGCEKLHGCDYPCEDFQMYCRLLMFENAIYGSEIGEQK